MKARGGVIRSCLDRYFQGAPHQLTAYLIPVPLLFLLVLFLLIHAPQPCPLPSDTAVRRPLLSAGTVPAASSTSGASSSSSTGRSTTTQVCSTSTTTALFVVGTTATTTTTTASLLFALVALDLPSLVYPTKLLRTRGLERLLHLDRLLRLLPQAPLPLGALSRT